jgi:hypothetical protein
MEIKIELEDLRKRSLFVATPMYGGQCHGNYTRSMCDLTALCVKYGINMKVYYLFNESLITRARNYCADEFMRSDFTHMMFIDSDIGFDPNDVITLLAIQSDDSPYDIIGGPYPKKCISWEKIVQAVNKGAADENPNALDQFVGDYVFNPVITAGTEASIKISEPAEVLEIGTGFMMIRKETFKKFNDAFPQQSYKPDHVRTAHFDGSREIMAYFDTPIDGKRTNLNQELQVFMEKNPEASHEEIYKFVTDPNNSAFRDYSKRYLSEDYMFCQWVRNIGMKAWLCPWMSLNHTGSYTFGGSLAALASIGASATADVSKLKK